MEIISKSFKCVNIDDFTPLEINEPKKMYPKPVPPPYNGWGTEEDSLQSWKSLENKPYVKDYREYARKERYELEVGIYFIDNNPLTGHT